MTSRKLATPRRAATRFHGSLVGRIPQAEVNFSVHPAGLPPIHAQLLEEFTAHLHAAGYKPYRAKQVIDWLYRRRASSPEQMTDLPQALRAQLAADFTFASPEIVRILGSQDTTRKFLFRLRDANLIETVLIPASPALYGETSDRRTVCVSSQVGCAYGCKFCASGLDGWTRNLDAGEIVQQLLAVEAQTGEKIDNVVFMGMGEPLANLANLMRAVKIINAPWGLGIGARHITVSTSGLAPQIRQLAEDPTQFRLALSLHGATDEVRDKIMPVNRKYPLPVLLEACDYYVARKRRMLFEYILIAGINDTDEQAHALAQHARRLSAKVNLIPYNTVEGLEWTRPSRTRQQRFHSILRDHGIVSTLRLEKGHDIAAACGQLRLQAKRQQTPRATMMGGAADLASP
ncbi:MAG: 23S rRNA (adenine(2503)-C(2))-methyltransferase RlmN [Chthoniobacterales bacterium]